MNGHGCTLIKFETFKTWLAGGIPLCILVLLITAFSHWIYTEISKQEQITSNPPISVFENPSYNSTKIY